MPNDEINRTRGKVVKVVKVVVTTCVKPLCLEGKAVKVVCRKILRPTCLMSEHLRCHDHFDHFFCRKSGQSCRCTDCTDHFDHFYCRKSG